jgi:copper chaperone
MLELQIPSMTCGGCAGSVTKVLRALDEDAVVDIDLAGKKVRVQTKAGADTVARALADAGYPVR